MIFFFFSGFGDEYFQDVPASKNDKSFLKGYKSVLNTKANEETLVSTNKTSMPLSPSTSHIKPHTSLDMKIESFFQFFAGEFRKVGTGTWPVSLSPPVEAVPQSRRPRTAMRLPD